jgi:peptidoglycan/LPS O-acetylase OafA/YrhL
MIGVASQPLPSGRATSERNVPALDLLRSYAVFSVVMAHVTLAFGAPPMLAPLQLGGTGVDLFFVLSGWLLGRQLMVELRDSGTIELTRFWSRRWLRTLPAYYAVLLMTFLQEVFFNNPHEVGWPYLVFGQNYDVDLRAFYVSWSLCVEEHFYVLVGPTVLLFSRARRWALPLLLTLLSTPLIFRLAGWYGSSNETHVRWDECAIGVGLAAAHVFAPRVWAWLCKWAPVLGGLALAAYALNFWFRWHPSVGVSNYDAGVYGLIFGAFVLFAVSSPSRRQISLPGATFLAKRAYAVYLLHPDALGLITRLQIESFPLFLIATWVVTLVAAEVLYRVVELPFMQARERFGFSKSLHRPRLA